MTLNHNVSSDWLHSWVVYLNSVQFMSIVSISITASLVDESVMVPSSGIASPNVNSWDINLWFPMKGLAYQQKVET